MFLSQFRRLQPTYSVPQTQGLRWIAEAHARSGGDVSAAQFAKLLQRYGCGPDKIEQRGTFLRDFTHTDWPSMQLFADPQVQASATQRMAFFNEVLIHPIAQLYPEERPDFQHWIHVSCTGYVSPSVIQQLCSVKAWGREVECLHAYHMGCYAALPALRMARGNLNCEILHTELCTLHLDPSAHEPEQLVIQSLFADGVMAYRVTDGSPTLGYEVLDLREWVAPGTLEQMRWDVSSSGFKMTLARDVPKHVQAGVLGLVRDWQSPDCVYAIHPGGPRIIDAVKESLGLSEEQVYFSREILRRHGNMSSATLPHVWELSLSELSPGTPVISMAFGPGLTLSASRMRKVGG